MPFECFSLETTWPNWSDAIGGFSIRSCHTNIKKIETRGLAN
jgi:hypothetical protein